MIRNVVMRSCQFLFMSTIFCALAGATSIDSQRDQYRQVMQELQQKKNNPALKTHIESLKNYPLYPYAKRLYLLQNIDVISNDEINHFLTQYHSIPDVKSLKKAFVEKLYKEQNWRLITALLNKKRFNAIEDCRYYYAEFQLGNIKTAMQGAENLWLSSKDMPKECDVLFTAWQNNGGMKVDHVLLRLELILRTKNIKLARYVINQLPASQTALRTELLSLLDDPRKLTHFAKNTSVSGFSHSVIHALFPKFVQKDVSLAKKDLPQIVAAQKIKKPDQVALERFIAMALFSDKATPEQKKWRDNYITQHHDGALIEKNLREAISAADYKRIEKWLAALSPEDQKREEWQYWKAKTLLKKGKEKQANTILKALSLQRGYYPLLAAQQAHIPYSVEKIQDRVSLIDEKKASLDKNQVIKRINELMYFQDIIPALQEWHRFLDGKDKEEIAQLAHYAYEKKWGQLSIKATIMGKLWNHFSERLPLIYQNIYKSVLKDKNISHSYAMGISRQESAYNPVVISPAGACGLMQLMPATAKETAQKIGLTSYKSTSQLTDPMMNVQLGSAYLEMMFNRFDNNRVLSSIAYNAGPGRVTQWLNRSNGKLDVDEFVESIPFNETRSYVKNVLFYDYMYRYLMHEKPTALFTKSEFNRKY